ncbi:PspC domain-containing protein [Agromyces sp. CFH 90414]|uniref:PspC domain-containing protein n=1 Tax=Agromyces agglutinans TaxID=2662258 RepID=A0A6I2F5H8_9MICO|nr:ATP-binding protein [Agromyces agglutinans]MRG59531.1 PspC domain-containing protein [Agromyces agglutinans]
MSTALPVRRLVRRRDCLVAGVAGGLADHLGWPVLVVRLAFAATALLGGAGVLLYAWLWALTPWAEPGEPGASRMAGASDAGASGSGRVVRRAPVAIVLTSLSVVAALVAIVLATTRPSADATEWIPATALAVLAAVGAGAWVGFIDRTDPERGPRVELPVRIVLTVVLLVLAGALMLGAARVQPVTALVAALVVLIGIALVYAPAFVRLWRDLTDERVRRIRDEQRSEMAAHLHDSVLQTLALIQNRAGASSDAGRLARAQERELRSWLHDGDASADSDLATDLRDFAAALELDYAVRIEVVAVGMSEERASGELAAAAREAMLNAARHAGGDVTVYLEGSPRAVDVYVRDRGAGFDPAEVPQDRLGVRESIIGRMRRAGGSATVARGAGGEGTEVHLRYETEAPRG